jgi:16S rRNA A1518/A1519 N6-dimethyltransferase RsmA/KsgA/DIM1 with predicted DNA glycosylase/AP lyase activity
MDNFTQFYKEKYAEVLSEEYNPVPQIKAAVAALKMLQKNFKAAGDKESASFYEDILNQIFDKENGKYK